MIDLEKKISVLTSKEKLDTYDVKIFDLSNKDDYIIVDNLIEQGKIEIIIDKYADQLEELEETRNPETITQKFEQVYKNKDLSYSTSDGVWVYYPWRKTLVHILKEESYKAVRNSRNFNLINRKEQETFSNSTIGIAGLNVGHPGALCLALEGGARNLKIADFDPLSVANLNRFRAGLCELGMNKTILTARQIYEIDPFYNLDIYDKGITPENIDDFLIGPKLDVLIEETDNLPLKIKLRQVARDHKIPVLMVTGNGPGLVIDIERYDQDDTIPILNGHLKDNVIKKVSEVKPGETQFRDLMNLLRDFIGPEFLDSRLVDSFDEVGKTIAGIPQLSESSFLRGAALCYFSRKIITGDEVPSGRYVFSLNSVIENLGV